MSISRHLSPQASPGDPGAIDPQAPKLHVVTFGCQMNKYDSSLVEGRFMGSGYSTTDRPEDADVILFNTCSVRDHAEERTWSWIGELKKLKAERPELVVGVMGCMAQRVEKEVFRRAGHVDLVAGTRQFQNLPSMVSELLERSQTPGLLPKDMRLLATEMGDDLSVDREGSTYTGGSHAYLAIMRGCDLNCTYCIVPTTRGRVRSRSIDDLEKEARWLVDQGVQVLTLLGQTVNSYGEDFPVPEAGGTMGTGRQGRQSLADLLRRLQEIEGLARIRLITLHPSYLTPALGEAIRDCDKVDRYLPLPAQAGSDALLKRMKRGYTLDLYRRRVDQLRELVPDVELGSDWIVGFCGETEEEFQGSIDFLEEQQFLVNYIFKYDPRPGTKADGERADDVPNAIKKERNRRLLDAAERVQRARFARYQGQEVDTWVESVSERDARMLLGRTRQGMAISFRGDGALVGSMARVLVDEASAYGMGGSLVAGDSAH
ncbi:MAG: tRNA (N6-isopentenyl adenosine(37)-C2)-methylthiotransferase MiaB [Planctomycetes bacterium]|nr:tRNA (N6-isopentenyl adenosine(37)-C2)-methylthiotransferase MiaB [Planctomycetota bacterium]